MPHDRRLLGATIIHQHYPSFIDLPPKSQYLIRSQDLAGLVRVLEHIRPLVVIDFNDGLIRKPPRSGKILTDVRRPITRISRDSVAADATGLEGRSGPAIAIEHDIRGRIFYQDIYTSLHICFEFDEAEQAENLTMHRLLLERFIGAYRYINPDVRTSITDGMPDESAPLRVGYYIYSSSEQALPLEERIKRAWPDKRQKISLFGLGRGMRALQDHVGNQSMTHERSEQLGAYLVNGFKLSENLLEIERLVDLAFSGKRPRSAVAEAMSILEVGLLAYQKRMETQLRKMRTTTRPKEVTWKFLIGAVLPALLDLYEGDKGPTMKRANEVLDIRYNVVHGDYTPSMEEVYAVLSFVRSVLSIFEMPDSFRGNWKLKPAPAPVPDCS